MRPIASPRYGRRAAVKPIGYPRLGDVLGTPQTAPADFDHTNGFDGFRMLGNGPDSTNTVPGHESGVGDCAYVGTVNEGVCDSAMTDETYNWPTTDTVVEKELSDDDGQDNGAVLTELLAQWHTKGLPWSAPISAYGEIPLAISDFWDWVYTLGTTYIGVNVSEAMENQATNGQPFDLTGTPADTNMVGGHCVVVIARLAVVPGVPGSLSGGECATYGERWPFTDRWLAAAMEEAHGVVTPQQVARRGSGFGESIAQLDAYLASLPVG